MDDSITIKPKSRNIHKILLILIISGAISSLCLIFFFYTLFTLKNYDSTPEILNAKQIGSTENSLLISWDCSGSADEYTVRCYGNDGKIFGDITTDIPFAAIRNLNSDSEYCVEISAVKDSKQYSAKSIICSTEPFCEVTSITILKTTQNSVTFSWEYNGADKGFTAVAYILDLDGKRHLTSSKAQISGESSAQCTIEGLLPNMNYTLAVMPATRYNKLCKADFTTGAYKKSYSKLDITRFVICSDNSDNSPVVKSFKTIKPNSPYKISIIISGEASKDEKVNMAIYIKDNNGNFVSETKYADIYTNPDGKAAFKQRVILLSIISPQAEGKYIAYLTIDGETAARLNFDVQSN